MNKHNPLNHWLTLFLAGWLVGCAAATPTPVVQVTMTNTVAAATATMALTFTPTLPPSATPSLTPSATTTPDLPTPTFTPGTHATETSAAATMLAYTPPPSPTLTPTPLQLELTACTQIETQPLPGMTYVNGEGLWSVNAEGQIIQLPSTGVGLILSPDKTRGIFSKDEDIYLLDLATNGETNLTNTPDVHEVNLVWSAYNPDIILFFAHPVDMSWQYRGYLGAFDLSKGQYRILDDSGRAWVDFTASSVSPYVAYDIEGELYAYDLDNERRIRLEYPRGIGKTLAAPAWSPDGQQVAWLTGSGVFIYDFLTMTMTSVRRYMILGSGGHYIQPVLWSPDGEWLTFPIADSIPERAGYWASTPDGLTEVRLFPSEATWWSPDGRWLLGMVFDENFNLVYRLIDTDQWCTLNLSLNGSFVSWLPE